MGSTAPPMDKLLFEKHSGWEGFIHLSSTGGPVRFRYRFIHTVPSRRKSDDHVGSSANATISVGVVGLLPCASTLTARKSALATSPRKS